jgi:prepilin-type N-terminal cleavage/methylation domain-containing protein
MNARAQSGATLIELLVGIAILAAFACGAQLFLRSILRSVRVLEVTGEAHESARVGIHLIERDLRGAGYGVPDALRPALPLATRTEVRIASDLNGDGDTADSNEAVGYAFDAARHLLTRSQGTASPQPMIEGLADSGLTFAYFDAAGGPLPSPVGAADRARIHRIDVTLSVERDHPDTASQPRIRVRQTASIALRNG